MEKAKKTSHRNKDECYGECKYTAANDVVLLQQYISLVALNTFFISHNA